VDDNQTCLLLGALLLSEIGAQVVQAPSGQAALAVCEWQEFDLILMDIQMPDLDGVETTRRIRQLTNANASAPIVACTIDTSYANPATWQAAGMDGYSAKPLSKATLRPLLARWNRLPAD